MGDLDERRTVWGWACPCPRPLVNNPISEYQVRTFATAARLGTCGGFACSQLITAPIGDAPSESDAPRLLDQPHGDGDQAT